MAVSVDHTPNPNAMKFTVGVPVGGPATHTADSAPGDPTISGLLAIDGVVSLFMTADFITLTKAPDATWEAITSTAVEILESAYPD
jgi:hypothetical protein